MKDKLQTKVNRYDKILSILSYLVIFSMIVLVTGCIMLAIPSDTIEKPAIVISSVGAGMFLILGAFWVIILVLIKRDMDFYVNLYLQERKEQEEKDREKYEGNR